MMIDFFLFYFSVPNPYTGLLKRITIDGKQRQYYDIASFGEKYGKY